jgi:hypothetical protein
LSEAKKRLPFVSEFSVKFLLSDAEQSDWPTLFSVVKNYLQSLL